MPPRVNLIGQVFGRWSVLSAGEPDRSGSIGWLCRCACGTERVVSSSRLRGGTSQSCGCLHRELSSAANRRHGHRRLGIRSPEYTVWYTLIQRCTNANRPEYPSYGGRGIIVCDRWRCSFENFLADMGPRPPRTSIDRIDNDGNYEPANCRWATFAEQIRKQKRIIIDVVAASQIRWLLLDSGLAYKQREVAAAFGVNVWVVQGIGSGRNWRLSEHDFQEIG
jgi:hypothetical protein